MSDFERSITIDRGAEQVFRFLSSISNLPAFLPWMREARQEEADHVFAVAEFGGKRQELNGFFRVDEEHRRLDWGSDGTPEYRGWLEIRDSGGKSCELKVHISKEMERGRTEEHLGQVLSSIKKAVEQEGGGEILGGDRRVA